MSSDLVKKSPTNFRQPEHCLLLLPPHPHPHHHHLLLLRPRSRNHQLILFGLAQFQGPLLPNLLLLLLLLLLLFLIPFLPPNQHSSSLLNSSLLLLLLLLLPPLLIQRSHRQLQIHCQPLPRANPSPQQALNPSDRQNRDPRRAKRLRLSQQLLQLLPNPANPQLLLPFLQLLNPADQLRRLSRERQGVVLLRRHPKLLPASRFPAKPNKTPPQHLQPPSRRQPTSRQ